MTTPHEHKDAASFRIPSGLARAKFLPLRMYYARIIIQGASLSNGEGLNLCG
jgi:hypothetical protein